MGIFIGILSGMLWGLNDVFTNIFSKHALINTTTISVIIFALALSFMQDASSSIAIFSYHYARKKTPQSYPYKRRVFWLLCISAIFAGPLGMVAAVVGIAYAGAIYAGVVTSCYPVVALILAIIFLRERPTKLKIVGIILSVVAVILISIAGEKSGAHHITIGLIFAACAMVGWGMESVLFAIAQNHQPERAPSSLLAIRQACSAVSYLVILMGFVIFKFSLLVDVFAHLIIPSIIIACVVSACISYIAYYNTIKRIGASLGTTFNATFIFWAAIFSLLFQSSHIHLLFILWGALLILGIYLASANTPSSTNAKEDVFANLVLNKN